MGTQQSIIIVLPPKLGQVLPVTTSSVPSHMPPLLPLIWHCWIMALSMYSARSCAKGLPVPPKPNWVHSSSMPKLHAPCVLHLMKSAATPLQMDNSSLWHINDTVNNRDPIQSTCGSAGSMTAHARDNMFWCPGNTSCADYFCKHHSTKHHQSMCYTYLHLPHAKCNHYTALLQHQPKTPW